MTQEDKKLLLKDLLPRQLYGVKAHYQYYDFVGSSERLIQEGDEVIKSINLSLGNPIYIDNHYVELEDIKPYLRPMSSMTEEEKDNLQLLHNIISDENYGDGYSPSAWNAITEWEDYCNARHLDYRGLIPMRLALEAPEGMYK